VAKAWYQYPFDSGFGTYPDPLPGANYPKPDANFAGIPNGTPITALAAGVVTGARAQPWGPEAYSITVKLDKPLNSVATHMAYNYVGKPQVSVGQRVGVGTTLAKSGNPYNIGTAFAFIDTDVYGTGSKNEPFTGTYVNHELSPIAFLKSIQGGNVAASDITLGQWADATIDQLRNSQSISNLLGAQPSQNIKNFFVAWAHVEGGSQTNQCHFNPLNTMQEEQGATQCSGAMPGIKAYPDSQTGTNATLDALANGNYGALLNALVTNDEANLGFLGHPMAQNVAEDLSVWVAGRRNPIKASYIFNIMADAGISHASISGVKTVSGIPGAQQDQINSWRNVVIGQGAAPQDSVPPFQNPLGDLSGLNNFFSALQTFFSNPVRLIKILGGAVMIIAGLVLLVRSLMPGISIGGKA
jgi:hypothetical protein